MPVKTSNIRLINTCASKTDRSIEKLRALLRKEPDLNYEWPNGDLPLRCALVAGKEDWAVELLKRGAVIPKNDGARDKTLLRLAADMGLAKAAALLLEKGAAVDYSGRCFADFLTPLHAAAVKGHKEVIKVLLDHGANPHLSPDGTAGLAPLLWAAKTSEYRMVEALLSEDMSSELEIKDNRGNTPLSLAVQAGAVDVVNILIKKGASLKVSNENGLSPLSLAAGLDCPAIVQLLIDRGANIEEKTSKGQTALTRAVVMGIPENVQLLLSAGASPRTEDTSKTTPLAVAESRFKRYEAVLALLQSHSDRNKHASPTNYTDLPSPEKIFDRLVVAVCGTFRGRTHANLEEFIISHGGTFSPTVRANCTHLVTTPREAEKNGTKFEQASRIEGCQIVTIDWLLDSEKAKSLVSEESYRFAPSTGVHKKIIVKAGVDSNEDTTPKKPKDGFDNHCQPTVAKPGVNVEEGYDPWANIRQGSTVYIDKSGLIWDATLNQTVAAQNKKRFYRIQLLVSADGTEYHTRTRWGRVGGKGRSADLGDGSLNSALGLFERKFEEKSGLAWKDRFNHPIADKYIFIESKYEED